jgi:diadenosine tetraphosphatase ApaH/serine/threonine PP2A family protein phosphatase
MTPSVEFTLGALTDAQRGMLDALPRTLEIAGGVLAVHGTPESDVEYLLEDKIDERLSLVGPARLAQRLGEVTASLVLCGHSHHQHMAHAPGGRLVVNPGSVGCPRYADNEDAHLAEAYTPHARYAIATQRGGQWTIESIALAYDWSAVAARAVANGRPDWARRFLGALAPP